MAPKFWMCMRLDAMGSPIGAPTVRHYSESIARAEAERLARVHGSPVLVLESVAEVRKTDVAWTEMDGPPF